MEIIVSHNNINEQTFPGDNGARRFPGDGGSRTFPGDGGTRTFPGDGSSRTTPGDGSSRTTPGDRESNRRTTPGTPETPTTFTNTNLTDADIKAGKIVKLGMKGDIVGKIQDLLINKGFKRISKSGLTDNTFGNRTKRMVQAFQAWAGLNDDGAVGPKTWAALNNASSGAASTSTTTTNTQPEKSSEVVPGTDIDVMEESLKKKLRKNLEIYI